MSNKALHWAWELQLGSTEKFVLIALADMADEEHSCFPGQATLAAMVGASESTVRRALKKLEDEGVLTREERRNKQGYKTSDRYFLQLGSVPKSHRSNCTVGADLTGHPVSTSPVIHDDLTGQSDRYIEEEPKENHQKEPSEPRKRGTRIPEPFMLTAAMKAWASHEVPGLDLPSHTREFVDHFRAASGSNATKRDWVAAWRNWMRRAHRSTPGSRQTFTQQKQDNNLALLAEYREGDGRAEVASGRAGHLRAVDPGA